MCPSLDSTERLDRPAETADRSVGLILVAMVALTVFFYHLRVDTIGVVRGGGALRPMTGPVLPFMSHNLAALGVLGIVPLLAARWLCGRRLRDLGLGRGRWRLGLVWVAVGIPLALLAGWASAGKPLTQAVYPLNPDLRPDFLAFLTHMAGQLVYYLGWEILFRGVLLFGLERRIGFAAANMIQTALSVIAHFGRPVTETLAAIPAGLAFGGIAHRTRSIWYVVVIHLVVGAAQDWFIVR
jgi:membrane protease YdiL (CAAX protease family)